ncbi:ankyrin repeat family A protein 2 [Trichoderma asperellum]|uniref:Ankyrin repeat family A protein 2 n=1 Tax=Trichoderma asperellum TaxID=101201 RepID=A0A6V8R4Y3_TRIAP|nr:ankyrin repeat family A protein 2 [Trichoderma asperellum]
MMERNIYALYLKVKKEKRGFSIDECETALIELVNFYPRTTLILDALDECEMDTREALARILGNLVDKGEGTVKVFIASRKEADIEEYLGSQKLVEISTADNKDDIEKYVEQEVAKVGSVWSSVSAEVKEQVKKTIAEKSDGMFRWAYLQWEHLKKLRTNKSIHPIDDSTLESICSHLVVLDSQLKCQEATDLSEILERFLGVKGPQQSSSLQYQAWCRHMDIIDDLGYNFDYEQDLQPSEKSIFGICVLGLHKFLKGWWDKDIDVSQVNDCKLDLLAIAASYGHDELCSELISRGSDIHKGLDSEFGSALMEAIRSSQIKTVKLLLDKGANPNLVRGGHSPLCLAISWAKDLLEPLLEAGADPNMACSDCWEGCALGTAASYGSPLGRAVFEGSLKCVKLFVENGADVNAHLGGNYGSVLAAAIFGRGKGIEMVKYLIEEAGVNPTILSSSPPRSPYIGNYLSTDRKKRAEFLINRGHVQESVLLDIGVPKEDLPKEDVPRIGRGRVYLKNIF